MTKNAPEKSCDQPVDVIFVFDDKSCISLARDVIVHYKSLLVPETKLKFGVAFCSKTEVEHTGDRRIPINATTYAYHHPSRKLNITKKNTTFIKLDLAIICSFSLLL